MTKTVVVLGMHRSGTSVVAGLLHALGVQMGAAGTGERWIGRHWSNPTGHFEDPRFLDLNRRILGGDATGIRGIPRWEDLGSRGGQFRGEIEGVLAAAESDLWGWKDPWTVLTIDLFLPYLKNPHFIVVHRDRAEILESLRKRAAQTDEEIGQLIELYERRLMELERTLQGRPMLHVRYRELTKEPAAQLARLIGFLGLRPTRAELDRALGTVLTGSELHRQSRRMALTGVVGFPRWVGWVLKRDLGENPSVVASDLLSTIPKELAQSLRALL